MTQHRGMIAVLIALSRGMRVEPSRTPRPERRRESVRRPSLVLRAAAHGHPSWRGSGDGGVKTG